MIASKNINIVFSKYIYLEGSDEENANCNLYNFISQYSTINEKGTLKIKECKYRVPQIKVNKPQKQTDGKLPASKSMAKILTDIISDK